MNKCFKNRCIKNIQKWNIIFKVARIKFQFFYYTSLFFFTDDDVDFRRFQKQFPSIYLSISNTFDRSHEWCLNEFADKKILGQGLLIKFSIDKHESKQHQTITKWLTR
jgi:hypothetical protein